MQVPTASTFGFATTVDTNIAYSGSMSTLVAPLLQAQDGSFYATDYNGNMISVSQDGNVIWSVPNDYPQIATTDGGVIGASGVTYDNQGRATGQGALPAQYSWTGGWYTTASDPTLEATAFPMVNLAASFTVFAGGNASGSGTANKPATSDVQQLIAQTAAGYVGSQNWLDTPGNNKCNQFVQNVLEQAGATAPLSPNPGLAYRIKYYLGLAATPSYPALAGDWANPNTDLKCWRTVTTNNTVPVGPPLAPGTLPPDISIPGDVIAEAIQYSDATGHVGIIIGPDETVSADSAASCFPPYSPAGIIDISDYGFRAINWVDPYTNPATGQPCRQYGKKVHAVVKRFVCQ
jgi:hypothetical protein